MRIAVCECETHSQRVLSKNSGTFKRRWSYLDRSMLWFSGANDRNIYGIPSSEKHSLDSARFYLKRAFSLFSFISITTLITEFPLFFPTLSLSLALSRSWIRFLHLRCWWFKQDRRLWSWRCFASTQLQPNTCFDWKIGRHKEAWRKTLVPRRILANLCSSEKRQRTRLLWRFPRVS